MIPLYDFMIFLHVVLFVYWLGPDWGVYVMSSRVWQRDLSVAERRRWAVTLVNLSQISRNSLILLIPVGVTLTWELGATSLPLWAVYAIWLVALAWVAVSITMHRNRGTTLGNRMTTLDQGMRYLMISTLLITGAATVIYAIPFDQNWVGAKLIVFAFLLFNSIQQRGIALQWVAGLSAVEQAATEAERDAAEKMFEDTAPRSKINAYLTWAATLLIAFLGVTKLF